MYGLPETCWLSTVHCYKPWVNNFSKFKTHKDQCSLPSSSAILLGVGVSLNAFQDDISAV